MKNKFLISIMLLILAATIAGFYKYGRSIDMPIGTKSSTSIKLPATEKLKSPRTVSDVMGYYGNDIDKQLMPFFKQASITYPPKEIVLLSFKDTKKLELWARDSESFSLVKTYDIQATSGKLGPKLAEGDRQVPEGIYAIEGFNPNSSYHLSMKLNYPNAFDRKWANHEGRKFPGTNIFIHGKAVSIGCLAMGDSAIDELFVLTRRVGAKQTKVIISPWDPIEKPLKNMNPAKIWVDELYNNIELAIKRVRT